jgi:hypothetical protein
VEYSPASGVKNEVEGRCQSKEGEQVEEFVGLRDRRRRCVRECGVRKKPTGRREEEEEYKGSCENDRLVYEFDSSVRGHGRTHLQKEIGFA